MAPRGMLRAAFRRVGALAVCCGLALSACSSGSGLTPAQTLQAAITLQGHGELEQAKALYLKVLKKQPHNAFALFDLGVVFQAQGNTAEALANYQAALAADPTFASALYNEGTIYTQTDPTQAMAVYRKAISLQPNAPSAYLNLAFLLLNANELQPAIHNFAIAVHLSPQDAVRVPKKLQKVVALQVRKLSSASPSPSPSASGSASPGSTP